MKKSFLFIILFQSLISCNDAPLGPDANNTELIRTFSPVEIEEQDLQKISTLCDALAEKEGILPVLVATGAQYNFDFSQKNCEDRTFPPLQNIVTGILGAAPNFQFIPVSGGFFGFPGVETASSGVMAEICQEVLAGRTLMNPLQTTKGAIWFSTTTSPRDCVPTSDSLCIQIQTGRSVGGNNYKIHTSDWLQIKTKNPLRGFFVARKLTSTATCAGKSTLEMITRLK